MKGILVSSRPGGSASGDSLLRTPQFSGIAAMRDLYFQSRFVIGFDFVFPTFTPFLRGHFESVTRSSAGQTSNSAIRDSPALALTGTSMRVSVSASVELEMGALRSEGFRYRAMANCSWFSVASPRHRRL